MDYFKGESRAMKTYIIDSVRAAVTYDRDNRLRDYIDYGGRSKESPLSYNTIDRTFYSFFVYPDVLPTPLNYKADVGENPRELEKAQLVKLMNIIAEEIYVGRFDPDVGAFQVEHRLQKGELIPEPHLTAHRMSREEVVYNWLKYVRTIIMNFFITHGRHVEEEKLFQELFPDQLWTNIRSFVRSLASRPLWVDKNLSVTVFGGKQNYAYWEEIFKSGHTPSGQKVLGGGLNIIEMIKPP